MLGEVPRMGVIMPYNWENVNDPRLVRDQGLAPEVGASVISRYVSVTILSRILGNSRLA